MSVPDTSRIKDEFLASLSHELWTPLNAIVGYARMLHSGILAAQRKEKAIETIERNATSLTQIVEDVLDISRIVSGKIRLNVQPVDFPAVVGHGTTFRVKIPVMIVRPGREDVPRLHPRARSTGADATGIDLHGIHVLAVDDEPDALALVGEVLEAVDANVTTATSAEEALDKLLTETPDVVVADSGMPRVDGFQFIDRLRRHVNARVREVPAAALTAYARSDDRMTALRAGFRFTSPSRSSG